MVFIIADYFGRQSQGYGARQQLNFGYGGGGGNFGGGQYGSGGGQKNVTFASPASQQQNQTPSTNDILLVLLYVPGVYLL